MGKLDRCSLLAGDECTSLAELREQNAELQADLRDAVGLLNSILGQPFYSPGWIERVRDIQLYVNRPSVKAVMEEK